MKHHVFLEGCSRERSIDVQGGGEKEAQLAVGRGRRESKEKEVELSKADASLKRQLDESRDQER